MAVLKDWLGGLGLIILFVIALLYFMVSFIQTNNPDGFQDAGKYNSTISTLTAKAEQLQAAGQNVKTSLESEQPSSVFLFLIIYSAFTIPIAFLQFLFAGAFSIADIMFTSIFGVGASAFYIVFAIVNGLIMIGIVIAVLDAIRLGRTSR